MNKSNNIIDIRESISILSNIESCKNNVCKKTFKMVGVFVIFVLFLAASSNYVFASIEYPYCFRFTWIGPYDNKALVVNETCSKRLEDINHIPCERPLVVTDNDNTPDTVDLWENFHQRPEDITCRMVPGERCVKYIYTYNKGVQNITYMCAKVNATNGCYRQKDKSGSNIEVCVCESRVGWMPCNAMNRMEHKFSLLLIALITITIFDKLFKNS